MDFKRERALRSMLEAKTIAEGAKNAGIATSTMYRFMSETEFRERLREVSDAALRLTSRRLAEGSENAAAVLYEILEDATNPPQVRINAASQILQHGTKLFERMNLLERLAELEERATNDAES